ncbi:hypothetical protein [Mycobacterium hubeiense]|uniref:DUF7937 domain-containing protein n=1 Tax=Mycobacterium hubeiense TaxID=1867256 RepID=UPI000C7EB930|nr:hypothetical protein [Mycobacterium sp. QGD 101]
MTYPAGRPDVATTAFSSTETAQRPNVIRDAVAGLLVILGLLLPWNVYFGTGIAGTKGWVFGLLVVATLLSLAALAVSHVGSRGIRTCGHDPASLTGLRLVLNVPYFVVVLGFLAFTTVQSIRFGGTGSVPPGIGPGAWLGAAGALLAAQPVITSAEDEIERHWAKVRRIMGIVSLALALAAVLFNLYWRTRFVVPNIGDPDTGVQNSVVAVSAVLYGVVALAPVIIAARWIMSTQRTGWLATVVLGASSLVAGVFVWVLPVGRDLDAFHGIAQNTSTAGVGFEGYLAWSAVAAIVGTAMLCGAFTRQSADRWRDAARKCLLLIAVWCAGTALLRIVDLFSASVLDLPAPAYNSTVLMAFDLIVALLAMWLLVNAASGAAPKLLIMLLFGLLTALMVARVIVGVALVPRIPPLDPSDINAVYGNTLTQQITSTFDVTLCVLGMALLAIVVVVGNETRKQRKPRTAQASAAPQVEPSTELFAAGSADAPVGLGGASAPATEVIAASTAPAATSKIFRQTPEPDAPASTPDRVAEVLAESTQRFAAGTTYGGATGGRDAGH